MNSKRSKSRSLDNNKPLSVIEACSFDNCSPPPLSLGNRIVWLSDDGPEFGVIKWLGKLPDIGNHWMAGVHFDNPVGSGTGVYNEYQLFEAPMNHASLVPVIGLLRAEDLLDSIGSTDIPQKPRRNKRKQERSNDSENVIGENFIATTNGKSEPTPTSISSCSKSSESNKPLNMPVNVTTTTRLRSPPKFENQEKSKHALNGIDNEELGVGLWVEVNIDDIPRYGVIKWIGTLPTPAGESKYIAGIELEEELRFCSDGTWNGKRYFECPPNKGHFVRLSRCKKDSRFISSNDKKAITAESSRVTYDIPPLSTLDDLKYLCGKVRGIQGHHNSCYLDATLFAMFSCTTIFESLLHRPQNVNDIAEYSEVQRVLKEEIVNPLRANLYVGADKVMHLRTLLEKLSSVRGLTSEEKDPEEFLNLLLNEILKAEPYLKLSSGLESFFYQLFIDKDEKLILPTVQQLFDQSFLASDFKLREIPPCLLIQMPRFGRQFKMYSRIIPSLYLDITDVLENSPRQCTICGLLAEYECKECFGQFGEGLDSTALCQKCLDKTHAHRKRAKHKATKLLIPSEFRMLKEHTQIQRIYMELFAVLCIETSHYVCFVKCGNGPDAPWCFFDSMADRNGEQDGYNIPEVVSFPNLRWWLSEEGTELLLTTKDDKLLPEMARRLLCDAYMCMYQSPDMMIYR